MPAVLTPPPGIDQIRALVSDLCAKHRVARLDVFGSVASGVASAGSDVDLLVQFMPEVRAGLFEMAELKDDIEERLGCRVDLLSLEAVQQSRNPYRRRSILAAPVNVYTG